VGEDLGASHSVQERNRENLEELMGTVAGLSCTQADRAQPCLKASDVKGVFH